MSTTSRLLAVTAFTAAGLLAAAPAHAVVDPVALSFCLAESATSVTALVDPTAPGIPAEIPAVACLAP
ncbi:hypothetical protein [Nonomuraea sp. NPDC048826]|uniref:hypothetical protein n=1 Tax=Nonomuraea sp. NPDC048826 TaxID=3364347 RepID=UPI00371DC072